MFPSITKGQESKRDSAGKVETVKFAGEKTYFLSTLVPEKCWV